MKKNIFSNTTINFNLIFTIVLFVSFFLAIGSGYYKYVVLKDYKFLVEQSCDPETEQCFFRDCENTPDECPPNGLSYYKKAYIKAADFPTCTDNSCLKECNEELFMCRPIACDESQGDVCVQSNK